MIRHKKKRPTTAVKETYLTAVKETYLTAVKETYLFGTYHLLTFQPVSEILKSQCPCCIYFGKQYQEHF